ncbi:hypothetical protein NON20_22665 [Synechocystis sp. B12]|nr:hypothetical protein NON20_22665 [Synechocystis sp. B12]
MARSMPDFQTFIAIVTTLLVFLTGVALKYDTIYFRNYALSIPQWAASASPGLLSRLWSWINSYGGLSELRKSNEEARIRHEQRMKELRQDTAKLRQQNEKLAELESKLDIVLQSSGSSLTPPLPTDNN